MDANLEKQISEVVAKNIPQIQAQEFKSFIEEANSNKERLTKAINDQKQLNDQIAKFQVREAELNQATAKLNEASTKLVLAETKERRYDLDIRDEQIKQRDFVIGKFFDALAFLTKNPRAIEVMNSSNMEFQAPYYNGSGQYITPSSIQKNESKTTEHLETKE